MTRDFQEQIPRLLLELGYFSLRMGSMPEACALLEAAQTLRPSDPTPALFLGMLHFAQGQYAGAERLYRQVLQQHEEHDLARAYLAESLIVQKRWSEAESMLNTVTNNTRDPQAVAFAGGLLNGLRAGIFQRAG